MAPTLIHPPGTVFIDDNEVRAVHVDAATYYGGGDTHFRSRTYSHVWFPSPKFLLVFSYKLLGNPWS